MPEALGASRGSRAQEAGVAVPAPVAQVAPAGSRPVLRPDRPLTVLITVPTLDLGAADEGAVGLAKILAEAGHRPIVAARGGRLAHLVAEQGGEVVSLDTATRNPAVIARNAVALRRLIVSRGCDVVHAHGRAPGWSAWLAARTTGKPFLATCHTGFRDQNLLKHWYNGVMARGDVVIAASERIAELVAERHHVPPDRLAVIHPLLDLDGFDPAGIAPERVAVVRAAWGVRPATRVVLVPGRILRRHGQHVAVAAARRLKESGISDVVFVLDGEDGGRSRYSGELWDLVLSSGTADIVRITGPGTDPAASLAAASVVVCPSVQLEGIFRPLAEAMAMARPVIASDLAAGPDLVPVLSASEEDRATALRCRAGDDAALAAALVRVLALPEPLRHAMGQRARARVLGAFDRARTVEQTLATYARVTAGASAGSAGRSPAAGMPS